MVMSRKKGTYSYIGTYAEIKIIYIALGQCAIICQMEITMGAVKKVTSESGGSNFT